MTNLVEFSLITFRACVFSIISAYYRLNIVVHPRNDITWDTMPIYGWRYGDLPVNLPGSTECDV